MVACCSLLLLLSSCINSHSYNTYESDEPNLSLVPKINTETVTEETNYTDVDLELKSTELSTYSLEIQEYMDSLMSNKTFMLLNDKYEYVQVIDLNNDNTPEIIVECSSYSTYEEHFCYVFSKNENDVFVVPHSNYEYDYTVYSYYGSLITAYSDEYDNNVFISDFLYGGIDTGWYGKKRIFLMAKKYMRTIFLRVFLKTVYNNIGFLIMN